MVAYYNFNQTKKQLDNKIAKTIKKRCKTDKGNWSCRFDNMTLDFYFENGHVCQHFARLMSHRYITKAHVYKKGKLLKQYETFRGPKRGITYD